MDRNLALLALIWCVIVLALKLCDLHAMRKRQRVIARAMGVKRG